MQTGDLNKRLDKLEAVARPRVSLETKLQKFAAGLCQHDGRSLDVNRLLHAVKSHQLESFLNSEMRNDGGITWPAFCDLRQVLIDDFGPTADIYYIAAPAGAR